MGGKSVSNQRTCKCQGFVLPFPFFFDEHGAVCTFMFAYATYCHTSEKYASDLMTLTKDVDQHKKELNAKKEVCLKLATECRKTDEEIRVMRKKVSALEKKLIEAENNEIVRKKKKSSANWMWNLVWLFLLFVFLRVIYTR